LGARHAQPKTHQTAHFVASRQTAWPDMQQQRKQVDMGDSPLVRRPGFGPAGQALSQVLIGPAD